MMHWKLLQVALLGALLTKSAWAVPVATDVASNSDYAPETGGAWKGLQPTANENPQGTDNGGYGFLPWNFQGGFHDSTVSPYANLNHFIDAVDFGASTFNNLGSPAFALTNANIANFGFASRATRVFSQPLAVGGTFSVEFDNPALAPLGNNDETGYVIRLNSGGGAKIASNPNVHERFGLFTFDGFHQGKWHETNASGTVDTGLSSTATTSGAVFRFTLESPESYTIELLPLGGGAPLYSAGGDLASTGTGSIDTLEVVMFGNGSGNGMTGASGLPTGEREFFFDQLLLDNPPMFPSGDFNRNGTVDSADYSIWRDMLDMTVANGDGADGNWDGIVNQLDYELWRENFGTSAAFASVASGDQGLEAPEPDSMVLVVSLFTAATAVGRYAIK